MAERSEVRRSTLKPHSTPQVNPLSHWLRWLVPLQLVLITAFGGFAAGALGTLSILVLRGDFTVSAGTISQPVPGEHIVLPLAESISPIFAPGVQHWSSQIVAWGHQYGIDPNLIATVMQIESCGDSFAGSSAGAQGLFQVMPFHFEAGQDALDPQTNAQAGLEYLRGALIKAGGHVGLALAGYNGGYGVIDTGWGSWPLQTQDYYLWGTAIYEDATQGKTTSPAIQNWLDAGGIRLCGQALDHLTATPAPSPTASGSS